ncbi:lysozyme inhibitor LprI family protein [Microcoleus sp. FACHB-68]|uniref:lysozyme inhibitor LprI family protein n=1 Tax=Microcoleus sp. FACHB-68 TaxID=2692826 RepID=UPI00168350A6|nr:lysozyme inhibitor LprI family protein [Microcoleus sp. FACHB-68]MBD1937118.1 DUF1311 domain-containing protein [Microcoleus sp. FACHB-68]
MLRKFRTSAILAVIALLSFFASLSIAASGDIIAQNVDCKNATTTPEMITCSTQSYQAADKQLNEVYQKVLAVVSGEQKDRLIEVENTWIKFRDSSCGFEIPASPDGREYPIFRNGCFEKLTKERTEDLQKYLTQLNDFDPAKTPNNNSPVGTLPDGNYRYVTAQLSSKVVSDEELVKAGGFYFLFRKKGNQILGYYNQIDSGNTICIDGKVNGNTVAGQAVETSEPPFNTKETVISTGEQFVKWDLARNLDVRRGQKVGNKIRYRSALLNLKDFSRINAGNRQPPRSC